MKEVHLRLVFCCKSNCEIISMCKGFYAKDLVQLNVVQRIDIELGIELGMYQAMKQHVRRNVALGIVVPFTRLFRPVLLLFEDCNIVVFLKESFLS